MKVTSISLTNKELRNRDYCDIYVIDLNQILKTIGI